MKKIVIAALLGFFLGVGFSWHFNESPAKKHDPEVRFEKALKGFSRHLKLDETQKEKVAGILQIKRTKIEALRAESKPRFDQIRQETKDEINKILTPEQQKKYAIMDEKMAAKRKN